MSIQAANESNQMLVKGTRLSNWQASCKNSVVKSFLNSAFNVDTTVTYSKIRGLCQAQFQFFGKADTSGFAYALLFPSADVLKTKRVVEQVMKSCV